MLEDAKNFDIARLTLIKETAAPFITIMYDLDPIKQFIYGIHKNIIFVGDSIHCVRPHLALGTAMALKDGYYLGQILGKSVDIKGEDEFQLRLQQWEKVRSFECNEITNRSRTRGNITQGLTKPIPIWTHVNETSTDVLAKVMGCGEKHLQSIQKQMQTLFPLLPSKL